MGPFRLIRSAARAAVLLLAGAPLAAEWTAPEVLARSKEAHGGAAWDPVQTLVLTGAFHLDGCDDPVPGEIREDLPRGRYLRRTGAGEALHGWGFDGAQFWTRIGSGPPFRVHGALREQVARTCAYMHARGFWFPERFPAPAAYLGLGEEAGAPCHVLRLEPQGALPLECRVDAGTFRILGVSWTLEWGTWSHAFLDYRTVQGLLLPFLIRCGWEGDPRPTRILAEAYQVRGALPEDAFRCWDQGAERSGPEP